MRVYDCFFFNGEWDMAEARMSHLLPLGPIHVAVEGTCTFSGERRDPVGMRRGWRMAHHVVETRGENPWARERHQRDACCFALSLAGCQPDDMVYLGDVDEFPKVDALVGSQPRALSLQSVLYYLNGWQKNGAGLCGIYAPFSYIQHLSGSVARDERYRMPEVVNAGWHFTYQGGANAIRRKLKDFSHQELNTPALQEPGEIERRMEKGQWLVGDEEVVEYRDLRSFAPPAIIELASRRPKLVKELPSVRV